MAARTGVVLSRMAFYALLAGLGVSLVGGGVLGFFVWDLHRETGQTQRDIADVEASLMALESSVSVDMASLEEDVSQVQRSLGDLSELTGGLPQFADLADLASAALTDLETLQRDLGSLQFCFNDALSDSFESFQRWVENTYVFTYTVSQC